MKPERVEAHRLAKLAVDETKVQKSIYDRYKRITATDEATEEDYARMAEEKEMWRNKGAETEKQFVENKIQELIIT